MRAKKTTRCYVVRFKLDGVFFEASEIVAGNIAQAILQIKKQYGLKAHIVYVDIF